MKTKLDLISKSSLRWKCFQFARFCCIFVIIIVMLSNIFLRRATTIKATSNNASDLESCTIDPSANADTNSKNITFKLVTIAGVGTPIAFIVNFRNINYTKQYNFDFEKFESVSLDSSTASHGVYTYKNSEFPASKLVIDGGSANIVRTLNFMGAQGITNPSAGDNDYQNFATAFMEKRSEFSSSCTHPDLFGAGTFQTEIVFNGGNPPAPPTIRIGGNSALKREETVFQLKRVLNKVGAAPDDVIFEFAYLKNNDGSIDPQFTHFVIKILGTGGNAFISECSDIADYTSCDDYTNRIMDFQNNSLLAFWNHVYNSPGANGTVCGTVTSYESSSPDKQLATWSGSNIPDLQCLNTASDGWLKKWGVEVNDVSITNPAGEPGGECGNATDIGGAILVGFCNITVMVRTWAMSLYCFAQNKLVEVLGQQGITSSACTNSTYTNDPTMKNLTK